MNALMTIQVRVLSAQALAQLRALEAQSKRTAIGGIGGMSNAAKYGIPQLSKWGNQVQWAGRQLQYNFSLPIAIAMGLASKFALENEAAMVRVRKVYGDTTMAAETMKNETNALAGAFEALSNQYGVHQKEVIGIAGDWAAAGASGIALAKVVKMTLETMVLGEIDAAEATRNLIAIQAQYGQNTKQLARTIEILNMVENQTGTTMKDLMDGMARASGVARTAGIDVEHLSAMIAALTPAAGSAATAGNGLRTIISRILAPTTDSVEVMKEMGVEVNRTAWQSLNATERLEAMGKAYQNLSGANRILVGSIIASRWQVNRFDVLMRAVTNTNSYYWKSLKSTADRQALFAQKQKELNQVLESSPQRMKQAFVILQNAMADVIQPLLPFLVYLASELARAADAFANMGGETQKLVLAALVLLAVIGPIARYVGSVANLFGLLSAATHWFAVQLGIVKTQVVLANGEIALMRKGIIGLAISMITFPFKMFAAGWAWIAGRIAAVFALIAARAVAFNAVVGTAMFGASITSFIAANLARLGAWLVGGFAKLMIPVTRIWTALNAMLVGVWTSTMVMLRNIWIVFAALMRTQVVAFRVSMAALFGSMFAILKAISIAGWATVRLVWAAWRAGEVIGSITFRATMITIHATMMAGIRAAIATGGAAITVLWATLQRMMVIATVSGAAAIRAIWVALLFSGRATVAGLVALGGAMRTVAAASAAGVVMAFRALPLLILGSWRLILVGLLRFAPLLFGALTSPIGLAIMAALGLAYAFRDKLVDVWHSVVSGIESVANAAPAAFEPVGKFFDNLIQHIIDAFWALPEGVRNALIAVVTVVRDAALAVYDWFSYLNPWAHHSPSLVESVTSGMDAIMNQYGRAKNVGSIYAKAASDLAAFKKIAGSMSAGQWSDERKDVRKAKPSALPMFNTLVADLGRLNPLMARQEAAVKAQQAVVDAWSAKLDKANNKLDEEQAILDKLKDRLQAVQDRYDAHAQALRNFAEAPIAGMGKMNEAIFQNEMAQKRLQLQMAKWKAANGDVDSLRNRLGLLRGDIETLTGQANDLRMAGAGSDILGPIQDQIAAMEAQAKATTNAVNNSPIDAMQQQLDKLQQQGELLQLQYDVKYDPLTHQIQQLANAQKELRYEDIVAGIHNEQAAMDALQPRLDQINAAVRDQEQAVKQATAARDRLQQRYDAENKILDSLNKKYQNTQALVQDIESALRDMGSAASQALQKADKAASKHGGSLSNNIKTMRAGANANFPEVGGKHSIQREGGMADQSKLIDQFTKDTTDQMNEIFGGFDMFAPIKRWWKKTWDWIKTNLGPVGHDLTEGLKGVIGSAVDNAGEGLKSDKLSHFIKKFSGIWDTLVDVFRTAFGWIKRAWRLFKPDIERIGKALTDFGHDLWKEIGPEIAKFGKLIKPVGDALKALWRIAKPVLAIVVGAILGLIKVIVSIIGHVLDPVLDIVIGVIKNTIKVFRGLIEIVTGVLTGDWKLAWQGIKDVVGGIFGEIWNIVKNGGRILWGIVEGIVGGVVGFFKWLWDELVGHSIVPDIVDGIVWWFQSLVKIVKWLWNNVLLPIYHAFKAIWNDYVKPALKAWWNGIKTVWRVLFAVAGWLWDNVLRPVFAAVKSLWNDFVKPALAAWWNGVKTVWRVLFAVASWLWDNVLKPVFDKVKSLWSDKVKPELSEWFGRFKSVWDNLTRLAGWIKDNVMDPIFNAFKTGWNAIKSWFQDNGSMILNPIKSVVRGIVDAINWVIKGLNKLDELPGVSVDISTISLPKEFADGGSLPSRRVGHGFVTSGARAIVGEGKANYPEWVIPSDPTYRHRAQSLLAAAADRIGMQAIPMHADGGILGDIGNSVVNIGKSAWSDVKEGGKLVVSTTMEPFFKLAEKAADRIDWSVGRQVADGGINLVRDWIKGVNAEYKDQYSNLAAANAPASYSSFNTQAGDWQRVSFRGVLMDAGQVRAVLAAEKQLGQQFHITQGSYSTSVAASGSTHAGGGAFDATSPVSVSAVNALRAHGQAAWIRSPAQGPWPWHIHSIMIGDPNLSPAAAAQVQSFLSGGIGLKYGGIIKARQGGTTFTGGEGGRDEAVIPLPRNWKTDAWSTQGGSVTNINISGNLEFPNIKNGEDAQAFIDNLVILAKD